MKIHFILAFLLFTFQSTVLAVTDPKYPYHPSKNQLFTSSDLPIIKIDLEETMAKKEEDRRIFADMKIHWNKNGSLNTIDEAKHLDYDGKIGIRYRGNSSYLFSPKKAFSFKTWNTIGEKQKVSLIGIPKDDDWVLLAPFNDRSLIRDILLFDLMRGTFDFVPEGRYCELVLNGVYEGIYILTSRPRQGSNRINIKKPTGDEGDGVTGGYMMEIDRDDSPGFWSKQRIKDLYENNMSKYPYYILQYPDAEDITTAQTNYIKNHVYSMEKAISSDNFKDIDSGYRAYLDTASLINYFLAQEFSKNIDGYRLSTPMYKYNDSKDKRFKFSIWDFNISMSNADYAHAFGTEGWVYNTNKFPNDAGVPWMFKRILQDEVFYTNLKNTWTEYRKTILSDDRILHKIDSLAFHLKQSQERNFITWNYWGQQLWPNYYIPISWEDELDYLKKWLLKRTAWIDSQWSEKNPNLVPNGNLESALTRGYVNNNVNISEWMTSGNVNLTTSNVFDGNYALSIRSGGVVFQAITELSLGKYTLRFQTKSQLNPSAYFFVKYHNKDNLKTQIKKIIPNNNKYTLINLKDIEISNHFIELGFGTENTTDDIRLWVDAIELIKQNETSSSSIPNFNIDPINITFNNHNKELEITIQDNQFQDIDISIYDIVGRLIWKQKADLNQIILKDIFTSGQLYIIKVGNRTKKIIF